MWGIFIDNYKNVHSLPPVLCCRAVKIPRFSLAISISNPDPELKSTDLVKNKPRFMFDCYSL